VAGRTGQPGFADVYGAAARFHRPQGVVVHGNNKILVADTKNLRIRMIAGDSARVTTIAGNSEVGFVDGSSARFDVPLTVVLDEGGRLLEFQSDNLQRLRVVDSSLAPPQRLAVKSVQNPLSIPLQDYGKLVEDTELADVTFAVDGQRFPAHRCILAAHSAFFSGLFKSGRGMSEGGSSAAG